MKFCPKCEIVADDELETCVDCGEVLLGLDELAPEDAERLILLTHCQPAEAQVLRATLENEGIEAMVEDEGLLELLNPFDISAPDDEGDVRVLVHLKDAEAALAILEEKEAGELTIEDDAEEYFDEEEEAEDDEDDEELDEEDDEDEDDEDDDWDDDDDDWDDDEDDAEDSDDDDRW